MSPGAGTVSLHWSSVAPPVTGTVLYYVSRDGGSAGGDCPTSSAPAEVLSCTDSGVSVGIHSYTVTALWRSWSAQSESTPAEVTFGPATHLVLAPATNSPAAGSPDALAITARTPPATR